jgi:hypothetical protein
MGQPMGQRKKAPSAVLPRTKPKKEAVGGGTRRPAHGGRVGPDHHDVDGDNGASSGAAIRWDEAVADLPVGTTVIVRQHNGNDSGRPGVVTGASGGNRRVHLSDGRHIVFVVSQLVEPAPVPPDEFA